MLHIKRPSSLTIATVAVVAGLTCVAGLTWYRAHLQSAPKPVEPSITSTETFALVRHTWKTAAMARRIHKGMTQAQVARILGQPYQLEEPTMPGDIPDAIRLRETYYGQDGPLYVAYRLSSRPGAIVADVTIKRVSYYNIFD